MTMKKLAAAFRASSVTVAAACAASATAGATAASVASLPRVNKAATSKVASAQASRPCAMSRNNTSSPRGTIDFACSRSAR